MTLCEQGWKALPSIKNQDTPTSAGWGVALSHVALKNPHNSHPHYC